MVAPGTTAPVGSFTTPRNEVFAFWEKVFAAKTANSKTTKVVQKRLVTESSNTNRANGAATRVVLFEFLVDLF